MLVLSVPYSLSFIFRLNKTCVIQGGGNVHVQCFVSTLWCPLLFTHAHTSTSVMVRDHKCECFNFLVSTLAALTVFIGGLPELTIKARKFLSQTMVQCT